MQCCLPGFGFCSCVQIALKDFDFLVLSLALHAEIILQNLSFMDNKTEMGVYCGISSFTCMGLCFVYGYARTYEGIGSGVSIQNCWHHVSASEQTERPSSPSCYTNALVQATGELLREMCVHSDSPRADMGGSGGAGQANRASAGPSTGLTAQPLPHVLEAGGLPQSQAPVGSTSRQPSSSGTGFGPCGKHDLS